MQTTGGARPDAYDAHVHLSDPAYAPYLSSVLACMGATRTAACCVSTDEASSAATLELAARSPLVLPFAGVHPDAAGGGAEGAVRLIRGSAGRLAGIGEVGLDGGPGGAEGQEEVFGAMLAEAERLRKPVSVHSRRALGRVLDALSSHSVTACLHWFEGGRADMRRAADMGVYASFGPVVMYARDRLDAMAAADPSLVLAETDGPVRYRRCLGSLPAQPAHVHAVAARAARAAGIPAGEARRRLRENAERFLGIGR